MDSFTIKNQNNNLWYAARENFFGDYGSKQSELDFVKEFKRLMTDGEHPFDCKCIIHV